MQFYSITIAREYGAGAAAGGYAVVVDGAHGLRAKALTLSLSLTPSGLNAYHHSDGIQLVARVIAINTTNIICTGQTLYYAGALIFIQQFSLNYCRLSAPPVHVRNREPTNVIFIALL